MPVAQETQLEIDLSALESNYRYLRAKIRPGTKFLSVVKAFSYGHDAVAVARKLEGLGVDYFAVAYAQEGVTLREAGVKLPILVLHPLPVNFDSIIKHCLEPSLYSRRILEAFTAAVQEAGLEHYPVHLKFNTGLNRLGFSQKDVPYILARINGQERIKVATVFSHLAASEDMALRPFTESQISQFEEITDQIFPALAYTPIRHILNTSGIVNYPLAQFEMVRSGIGLYGFGNEAAQDAKLTPVATLKTVISQLHHIKKGESIGYNQGYISQEEKIIATLPLGHADGIGRQYGKGRGYVFVGGRKAPILGNVCMDMIMVDVTGFPCKEGDEVVVFGKNASAEHLAASAGTISYELLTGISQRVKRLIIP